MKRQSKKTSFFAKLVRKSNRLVKWLADKMPLLTVVAVALIIAVRNIDPATTYSGWDNVHPEFDLTRYAQQVFFGTWLEHQNLGAPMSLAHVSEVARLPLLFLLELFPQNLSRYLFIFLMYALGGVGVYLYLSKIWLAARKDSLKNWLAALGGIFYLLHILTLQQFYIAFEMFTVQFAFLPFVLLAIHRLAVKINAKNLLLFLGAQLLIAPSGHTPTVFYLGAMFWIVYAFFASQKKQIIARIKLMFTVAVLTLVANAAWIVPSVYYTLHNAHYVAESRDNALFAPESIASVREAATWENFFKGTQYLLTWQDYSFEGQKFERIFNEWEVHLARPQVYLALVGLGVLTVLGAGVVLLDQQKGIKRFAVLALFAGSVVLIWSDLFPTKIIIDWLYQFDAFSEAFRNAFTKLSVLYSFASVVLFVSTIEWLARVVKQKLAAAALIILCGAAVVLTAWPSFEGHFLSEKLKVQYPAQYTELFEYFKTRDVNLRVLQLPQLSHAGWEYYDWQFLGEGNGYQGMGFYMFGMPQAFANRDSDRWVETSDFFYHELKPILDTQNAEELRAFLTQYRVDLLVLDETRIDPAGPHDFAVDHALVLEAGLKKVWQKDFLTVYERESEAADLTNAAFFVPERVSAVAADVNRTRLDVARDALGEYVLTPANEAGIVFPFSNLTAHTPSGIHFENDTVSIGRAVPVGGWEVFLPGFTEREYFTSAAVTYKNGRVEVVFPVVTLEFAQQKVAVPHLPRVAFDVPNAPAEIVVFFNQNGVVLKGGETEQPVLRLNVGEPLVVDVAPKQAELSYLPSGDLDQNDWEITRALVVEPEWEQLTAPVHTAGEAERLVVRSEFPILHVDPMSNPSENCSQPRRGNITQNRTTDGTGVVLTADHFAVNCNGYDFTSASAAGQYVMRVAGSNQAGRGTKFFLNYEGNWILPEDYLFRGKEFEAFVSLWNVSRHPTETLHLNWETRSFGKYSENTVQAIELAPLPLSRLAGLQLTRVGSELAKENSAVVASEKHWFGSVYSLRVVCPGQECLVGLDQSYDDGWAALEWPSLRGLEHVRLNTWANGWQVVANSGSEQMVLVVYWPELVSLASMGSVAILAGFYLWRVRKM